MTHTEAISPAAAEVLKSLRANVESTRTNAAGKWGQVYLDNAIPDGMSRRSFAGYLSALHEAGLYRSQGDDCFGDVLIGDNGVSK